MRKAKYQWHQLTSEQSGLVQTIQDQCQLPEFLAQLLVERGCDSLEKAQHFLKPQLQDLHGPEELHGIEATVEKIEMAISQDLQITVYGDYDADGLTSTALMYETLRDIGAKVDYYIPNRFTDGYGPNKGVYQRLIEQGTQMIVTVDNGISGNEAIEYANSQGVEVVITDHHSLPAQLPAASAIVHPQYPGDEYPYADLSGVGVAFKVAWALLGEFPYELLNLVAIGELADLVEVTGENRSLITFGLQQLRSGMRTGLHELIKLTNADEEHLTDQDVGFQIAPRLNALGRIGDAATGVELLTTFDEEVAQALAQQVDQANQERQALVKAINLAAEQIAQAPENQDRQTLLIVGRDWHQGVLGIVASHIVQITGKPTIVASTIEDGTLAKGSGRGVAGFDLFKALDAQHDLMTSFGGHTMACGLSFEVAQTAALSQALEVAAQAQNFDFHQQALLEIAGQLSVNQVNADMYQQIHRLAPFGPGNEEPLVEITNAEVSQAILIGKERQHAKLTLTNQPPINVLAFSQPQLVSDLPVGSLANLVGTLSLNRWKGQTTAQVMLADAETTGLIIEDHRTRQLQAPMFQQAGIYLVFNDQLRANIDGHTNGPVVGPQTIATVETNDATVVVVDCPPELDELKVALEGIADAADVDLWLYTSRQPVDQVPARQHFVQLYQVMQQQPAIDSQRQLPALSQYLRVSNDQLIFMFQVFIEAGFVIIDNGLLKSVNNVKPVDLTQTQRYQRRQQWLKVQNTLLTVPTASLRQVIMSWLGNNEENKWQLIFMIM